MKLSWCSGGLLGVTILFVLAGYLATAGLLRQFDKKGTIDLLDYWRRRLWRLMPTMVVYVVVTAILCLIFSHVLLTKMRPDIIPGLLMYINWAKIFANESYFAAAGAPSPLTHFWTLALEFQFYLIWAPILLLLLKTRVPKRGIRIGLIVATLASAALMAVLYTPGEDPSRVYYGTDTRAFNLLIGCWLAFVWPFDVHGKREVSSYGAAGSVLVRIAAIGGVAGLIVMMLVTEGYTSWSYYGGILLCSVVSVIAIAGLVPQGTITAKILSLPPLEWIGKRSYAIYVWHYPILELMNPLNATAPLSWQKILLELAIIMVVAHLSYTFVEQPWRHGWPTFVPRRRSDQPQEDVKPVRVPVRDFLFDHRIACAAFALATVVAVIGLAVTPPVTVRGNNPDDKVVTSAALKKPLVDGVYDVVLIGDSVCLNAYQELAAAFPYGQVSAAGGRQYFEAIADYEETNARGAVGDTVIFGIGANGQLLDAEIDEMVAAVGPDKMIWFINVRGPEAYYDTYNEAIDRAVQRYPNVGVIDWHGASAGHDEWLQEDGIHLQPMAYQIFADLIVDTIGYEVPSAANTTYPVTVVGESVCLDAADALAARFGTWMIDCADVRSPADAAKVVASYAEQSVLGPTVVASVESDEMLQASDFDALVQTVGADRTLWLVNTRNPSVSWTEANNQVVASLAAANPNVRVIDWYSASAGHDEYFQQDGVHLTETGASAYVDVIAQAVGM